MVYVMNATILGGTSAKAKWLVLKKCFSILAQSRVMELRGIL